MSLASIIATNAGKQPEAEELGNIKATVVEQANGTFGSALQKSALIGSASIQSDVAAASSGVIAPEVTAIMQEKSADGRRYKQLRTFALRDNKLSFMYSFVLPNGATETVKFERGLFSTDDVYTCDLLDSDIARNGGIAHTVMNITGRELTAGLAMAKRFTPAAVRGNTSSAENDVTAKRYQMQIDAKDEELRVMRGQMQELLAAQKSPANAPKPLAGSPATAT